MDCIHEAEVFLLETIFERVVVKEIKLFSFRSIEISRKQKTENIYIYINLYILRRKNYTKTQIYIPVQIMQQMHQNPGCVGERRNH